MKLINKLDNYLDDKNYKICIKENQINILNYSEIIDFTTNKISVKCNQTTINIEGKDLIITKMVDNEMLINGIIYNLRIN